MTKFLPVDGDQVEVVYRPTSTTPPPRSHGSNRPHSPRPAQWELEHQSDNSYLTLPHTQTNQTVRVQNERVDWFHVLCTLNAQTLNVKWSAFLQINKTTQAHRYEGKKEKRNTKKKGPRAGNVQYEGFSILIIPTSPYKSKKQTKREKWSVRFPI